MPVIISDELVLSQVQDFDADNPLIGWQTLITPSLIEAGLINNLNKDPTDVKFPAANMAANTTENRWQIDSTHRSDDIALTFTFNGLREIDYFAFAAHNLGTNQRAVRIHGTTDATPLTGTYTALAQEVILSDDDSVLFRFATGNYTGLRLIMQTSYLDTTALFISVAYAGKLLVMERKILVAYTPITLGRRPTIMNNRSENGKYLGRIVTSEWLESAANFGFMSSDWYREFMDPFVEASQTTPFFFAWAPISYPLEVGYVWLQNPAIPEISNALGNDSALGSGNHLVRIMLDMQGIV